MEATAASIAFVQFAGQTVKYIVKAYQLWEEIKELPTELADLISDLKAHELLFREVDAQVSSQHALLASSNSSSATASLEHCRRTHKALQDMVNDITAELAHKRGLGRKVKATKVIMKKDVLQKLEKKLQRALALLQTSLQLYQLVLSKQQPAVIARSVTLEIKDHLDSRQSMQQQVVISDQTAVARMQPQRPPQRLEDEYLDTSAKFPKKGATGEKRSKPTLQPGATPFAPFAFSKLKRPQRFYEPSNFGHYAASYAKDTGAWEVYLQFPRWISETIYEFDYTPTMAGWMFNTRIYNVVPDDSEIFERVKMGDKAGVIELFQTRKASPFDKDSRGESLLFRATREVQPEICELLLQLGLHELLDDKTASPLTCLMHETRRWQMVDNNASQILDLFQSYLQDSESIPVERMFEMGGQAGYTTLQPFKEKFMQRYYERPARDRLEAVRLGSFVDYGSWDVLSFFHTQRDISSADVSLATKEKLSLMHSTAVGLGRRLPDNLIPQRRPAAYRYVIFDDGWYDLVTLLASRCEHEDLHVLEEVTPWDTDPVPVWNGTPLTSLVGGVLCFLSPDFQYFYWDFCLQTVLQHWVTHLQKGGLDLMRYGREEQRLLRDHSTGIKGAFDADSIRQNRTKLRKSLPVAAAIEQRSFRHGLERSGKWARDDTIWRPIRLIGLEYGPHPADWRLLWAPEIECLASEFWKAVEEPDLAMPGSWVE